ncbi:hypothetical protein KEM60_03030 [Austwickia sp. TVS 96-490-7B]|uniref:hypothetical protein n=1 Tax=Austwickia sp. TVS 96-490-7B TaxID=2830843 RepID=UPI001C59AD41|nr:hypothetical protein [Austwickia sp. TVS 96-490-7B]MBW3086801.1 hypothetical protein [Austwickia sp. TVS 96-490-7B]
MTTTAVPARRLRRPGWRDGRLLIGVILVLTSIALGARIVAAADHTVPVYAASAALVPGDKITADRLTRINVALGAHTDTYLRADQPLPEGGVIVREVRPGELLPAAAVVHADQASRAPIVVPITSDSARVLTTGSVVDVWVNERLGRAGSTDYGSPQRLVTAAPVGKVPDRDESRLTGTGTTGIQIHVPHHDVEKLIAAMDQGAKITLVPAAGSAQRDR